jgi:hypothetical protein
MGEKKMRLKIVSAAVAAAFAISLLGATSASAATEFGNTCASTSAATGYTLTTLSKPVPGVPLTAPIGGVITKVKLNNLLALPFAVPEIVKVLRSAGGNNFTTIAQALIQVPSVPTTTVADVRLPVQPGDRLGLRGEPFSTVPEGLALYCSAPGDGSRLGAKFGDVPVGATGEFMDVTEGGVPVVGVIEPDADNDGFGDETQDACPQSAAFQAPCPPVVLSTSTQVRKGSVTVIVTPSTAAPVSVKGVVKLGKGKKATLNGGTQNLTPGVLGKFKLKFSKKVKEKLKELSRKQKLTLKVTVSGTSVSGAVTTKTLKVKLKGQAKP